MDVVDNEVLISKVFERTALWDKRNKLHTNRKLIDKCWNEISVEMKVDEFKLRKRWKYLRDQFTNELGKVPPSAPGDDTLAFYPKWPFFKQLLFLKEVAKPRFPVRCRKKRRISISTVSSDPETSDSAKRPKTYCDSQDPLEMPQPQAQRQSDDNDEHLLFFRSLLPHVMRIPPHVLLAFRSKIQDVVEEFAYRANFN